ncbi:MAG: hypothetical protein AB7P69_27485, partial [Candidatus Binatia bacterium]
MDDFDKFSIASAIRARVGSIKNIRFIDDKEHTPLAAFTKLARQKLGMPFTVIWINEGFPGHFTLGSRQDIPVVFHARQCERAAYFRSLFLHSPLFERGMGEKLAEQFYLRQLADLFLKQGMLDQALQCLAQSKSLQHVEAIQPNLEDMAHMPKNEAYMTLWLHGLGHEFGHHVAPDMSKILCELDVLQDDYISTLTGNIIDISYPDTRSRSTLKDIIQLGHNDVGDQSYASPEVIRREVIADLISASLLLEAARELNGDCSENLISEQRLFEEIIGASASLLVSQQCDVMASWFTGKIHEEPQKQTFALSSISMQARSNLFIRAIRSNAQQHLSPFFPAHLVSESEQFLQAFSRFSQDHIQGGMLRADDFITTSKMRDTSIFYNFVRNIRDGRVGFIGVPEFLNLARDLGKSSPQLRLLASAVKEVVQA